MREFEDFLIKLPHLGLEYYIDNGEFMLCVRDLLTGISIWRGIIPRIQYARAYELYLRKKGECEKCLEF